MIIKNFRGMKEYEIALEDIKVSKKNLLGEQEGNGFKQRGTMCKNS